MAKSAFASARYDPLIYLPYVGLSYAHFFAGDWAEAATAASSASHANPRFSVPWYLLTAALVRLGRIGEAKSSSKRLLELQPGFTVSGLVSGDIITPERMAIIGQCTASGRTAGVRQGGAAYGFASGWGQQCPEWVRIHHAATLDRRERLLRELRPRFEDRGSTISFPSALSRLFTVPAPEGAMIPVRGGAMPTGSAIEATGAARLQTVYSLRTSPRPA